MWQQLIKAPNNWDIDSQTIQKRKSGEHEAFQSPDGAFNVQVLLTFRKHIELV